eukprot:4750868-Prymnesium_polylepis.1
MPAWRQRAPASTRAAGIPTRPIACSSGLSLVQGYLGCEVNGELGHTVSSLLCVPVLACPCRSVLPRALR